jgi:hypothetical protein
LLFLFRNNRITSAIPLALFVLLTHAPALLGYAQAARLAPEQEGVLYQWLCGWLTEYPRLSALFAALLVFVQALLVNNLADEFRILEDRSWLPALLYAWCTALLPDFLFMSAPLAAATFIPVAVRRICKIYKAKKATSLIFDSGFWIAVAVLLYPSAAFLPLGMLIGVNIMRSFGLRDQWVFVSGTVAAFALAFMACFWEDQGGLFLSRQMSDWLGLYRFQPERQLPALAYSLALLVLMTYVVLSFGGYYFRRLIETQKYISVLYWVLFGAIAGALLQPAAHWAHYLLAMPAVGILVAMSLAGIRRRLIAEILFLLLLGALGALQFMPDLVHWTTF